MIKNVAMIIFVATTCVMPRVAQACPRTSPAQTLPLGIASTDTSQIKFTLSKSGKLTIRRTLTTPVPAEAASCSVVLQGRFSRKLSYSSVRTLATRSTTASVVTFIAKNLPSVLADIFRRQQVQPTLHVRVITNCIDKDGVTVLNDTTPVVARYAECGAPGKAVGMGSFVSTLIRKLNR